MVLLVALVYKLRGSRKVKNMKKRIVIWMLAAMLAVTVAGCGAKEDNNAAEGTEVVETTETGEETQTVTAASNAFDIKGSDHVKLGDYKNMPLTITGDYEVTDEKVKESFASMFESYGPFYTEDTDKTTIGEGDIVDVDYVGKLDGVAFDGGSAKNQIIDVYNNASVQGTGYIEGFTEGLKGASVGDVIDCDVTFPEDYGNTDLAGKAVVFTFTVNSIQKEMTLADVDDNFAMEQFQVETVDEMYEVIRQSMEEMAGYAKENDTFTAAQDYLVENSKVEVPEDYLEARFADYRRYFIENTCDGDESQLEEYLSTYAGKSVEEMEKEWREGLEESIRLELVLDALAEELGVEVDEETVTEGLTQMVQYGGYESLEAMYTFAGYGDAAYGEKNLRKRFLYQEAVAQVMETATVSVEEPAKTEAEENANSATEAVEETENAE